MVTFCQHLGAYHNAGRTLIDFIQLFTQLPVGTSGVAVNTINGHFRK